MKKAGEGEVKQEIVELVGAVRVQGEGGVLSKFTKKDDWDSQRLVEWDGGLVSSILGKSKDPGKPHPARPSVN